jgi:hypothetical protein
MRRLFKHIFHTLEVVQKSSGREYEKGVDERSSRSIRFHQTHNRVKKIHGEKLSQAACTDGKLSRYPAPQFQDLTPSSLPPPEKSFHLILLAINY